MLVSGQNLLKSDEVVVCRCSSFCSVDSETVDYSTQYPWMFGVLAVLIATGQHPLGDYPSKYEENHKIRYRTHHIQALPDQEKVRGHQTDVRIGRGHQV